MCLIFLMSVLIVDIRFSLSESFRKGKADFSRLPWQPFNILKERCHFIKLWYFLSSLSKSKACRLCFLSAALSSLCSSHKVFTLFWRRKALNQSCKSCLEWTWDPKELEIGGVWMLWERCSMRTFGHCRTLISGQSVDTCCQDLNGTLPSSRDVRSGGDYINTASWPPSSTPGAPHVSSLPWLSGSHDSVELHMLQVSFT